MLLSSPELSWARVLPLDTYQNCHSITAIECTIYLVVAGSVAALTDGAPKNNQGGQGEAN